MLSPSTKFEIGWNFCGPQIPLTSKTLRRRLFFMRNHLTKSFGLLAGLLLVSASVWAHHGTGTSYDTEHVWTTWAKVVEFHYLNPHPSLSFERTDKNGKVEHWESEAGSNPSQLARAGWTKSRSEQALKPGNKVKLYLSTGRAGGYTAVVMRIENEKGESILGERENYPTAVDMDGVPGGWQPKPEGGK
jgi:hypothetical protein